MNPIKYLIGVRTELAEVVWPKPMEVIKLTLLVIAISTLVGAYVGLLDVGFTKLIGIIITK